MTLFTERPRMRASASHAATPHSCSVSAAAVVSEQVSIMEEKRLKRAAKLFEARSEAGSVGGGLVSHPDAEMSADAAPRTAVLLSLSVFYIFAIQTELDPFLFGYFWCFIF